MSLLKVAFYDVSLERTKMDDRYETVLSRCSLMLEVRENANKYYRGLKEGFQESISIHALVSEIFN